MGTWPQMRKATFDQISAELLRARAKHPRQGDFLKLIDSYLDELTNALADHHRPNTKVRSTAQIFASAATVAAMAIRIMEEGTEGYRYCEEQHPAGNFRLEPT